MVKLSNFSKSNEPKIEVALFFLSSRHKPLIWPGISNLGKVSKKSWISFAQSFCVIIVDYSWWKERFVRISQLCSEWFHINFEKFERAFENIFHGFEARSFWIHERFSISNFNHFEVFQVWYWNLWEIVSMNIQMHCVGVCLYQHKRWMIEWALSHDLSTKKTRNVKK
mgnify:CR=1 FL=1